MFLSESSMSEWKRFKDPSGNFYYFNTRSKVSTKEKPKEFGSQQAGMKELRVPVFCLPLRNYWNLVICKDGSKFFHNDESNVSQFKLADDESKALLDKVDTSLLALLIGVARGFNLRNDRDVYGEIRDVLQAKLDSNDKEQNDITEERPQVTNSNVDTEDKSESSNILVSGYSSSSDDSGEESEVEEKNDPSSIDVKEEDTLPSLNNTEIESKFIQLLNEIQLDPYSTWSIQAKRIMHDPRYYLITSNDKRDELFQTWCSQQLNNSNNDNENNAQDSAENSDEEDSDVTLEPTKYHYLAHIISKANITPETLFSNIKKENKSLFKELEINKTLTKKEQEQFASKVIAYYKRMDNLQRTELFKKMMKNKLRFPPISEKLSQLMLEETPSDSFKLETQLLQLENALLILDNLQNSYMQNEIMYYILGIKDKLAALKEILRDQYSK